MNRRAFLTGISALAALALVAATQDTAAESPERVVIAGGDLTEIAFALGAGASIIGVDSTSKVPAAATELPQIGYVRRLSAEGVLSLAPTHVLLADDAGPEVALDQLRAAGVRLSVAPKTDRPEQVAAKIAFVGEALELPARAALLSSQYSARLEAVFAAVARIEARPRVLFILSVKDGAPLAGGQDTSAEAMIEAAGGMNAALGFEGYKTMSSEAVLAAQPDVILMMEEHAERLGGSDKLLGRPDIAQTPAGKTGALIAMEGMLLLGFGPRTPEAIAELARALHPADALGSGL